MKIHEKISSLRRLKKISQQKMAEKLDLTVNGYADIEHGKTDVQMSRLEEIANALEVDIYELFNFGERNVVYLTINNSPFSNNNPFLISSTSLENITYPQEANFEMQKLQLTLEHKNNIIEQQSKEISYLKEIIELIRKDNT